MSYGGYRPRPGRAATLDGEAFDAPQGMRVRDRHVPNRPFGMYPEGDQLERLGKAIMDSVTLSEAARSVGADRKTATKLFRILLAQRQKMGLGDILCRCGRSLVRSRATLRLWFTRDSAIRDAKREGRGRAGSSTLKLGSAVEIRKKWTDRAADWRRLNVQVSGADFANEVLADIQAAVDAALERPVTLLEASAIGGYSVDHLGLLLKQGKIPNAGASGRPRIRRRDVPLKGEMAA